MDQMPLDKYVHIRSFEGKYLCAMPDKVSVGQKELEQSAGRVWKVEFSEGENFFRLMSRYGRYLGVSDALHCFCSDFSYGEVVQNFLPSGDPSSIDWKAERRNNKTRILTVDGKPLRANPSRSVTYGGLVRSGDWTLWRIEQVQDDPRATSLLYHAEQVVVFEVVTDYDGRNTLVPMTSIVFEGELVVELTWMIESKSGFKNLVVCTSNDRRGKLQELIQVPTDHIIMVSAVITDFEGYSAEPL